MKLSNEIDYNAWCWLLENISDNPMFLDLFLNNPFNEFGGKTVHEYAAAYGWPAVIAVLETR